MKDKKREMAQIASILYFEEDKGQSEIARIMNISRSYVSQLLTYAKSNGVVDITINIDEKSERDLREEIKFADAFKHLSQVYIMTSDSQEASAANIGKFAAPYVAEMINKSVYIGVNPGKSVQNLLKNLEAEDIEKSDSKKIVQMMGGFFSETNSDYSQPNEAVNRLKNIINCKGYYFNAPAIIDDPKLRASFLKQKDISALMKMWQSIDFALMGIGVTDQRSVLFDSFEAYIADKIQPHDVIGEINMNFFTEKGDVIPLLDDIKMGMDYECLKAVKNKVVICSAVYKAKALIGALRAGLINTLFIDSLTADEVVRFIKEGI